MAPKQHSDLFNLRIFPKCHFFGSATALSIIIALIALGTFGISYLNFWAAVGYLSYSVVFYFLVMPLTLCKYCYFKVTESITNDEKGETFVKLLPIDQWSKSCIHMHAGQRGWSYAMAIVWLAPIFLIGVSFFLNFSLLALAALFGFVAVLVGNYRFMVRICTSKCPIKGKCNSSLVRGETYG